MNFGQSLERLCGAAVADKGSIVALGKYIQLYEVGEKIRQEFTTSEAEKREKEKKKRKKEKRKITIIATLICSLIL